MTTAYNANVHTHCRFQNTESDLRDCQDALEGLFGGDEGRLSREELRAAKRLVETCMEILMLVADKESIDIDGDGGMAGLEQSFAKILDDANDAAETEEA